MDKGFAIIAQNTSDVNYINCALALAKSIKKVMPNSRIALITNETINDDEVKNFDVISKLPYGDLDRNGKWKLSNDWQIYEASPFEHTIKLEADLLITKSVDYWFDILNQKDVVVCTTIRNFKQEISNCRVYRKFIDENNLPDCYNAITYFKKSKLAEDFFKIVKDVFENWEQYKKFLKCNLDEPVTTDWAYALASHILGKENTTMPSFTSMSMIHMKQFVNNLPSENWTDALLYEINKDSIRINTIPQEYPLHYHIKDFAHKLL